MMLTDNSATTGKRDLLLSRRPAASPVLAVAIVADLIEEAWPSMDHVAEMLMHHLEAEDQIKVKQLRPAMRARLTRLPGLGFQRRMLNGDRLLNRFFDYPRWLQRHTNGFELFHLVDHSYAQLIPALPPDRTVVTCHDLDTFRCLIEPARDPRPRWFRYMAQRILDGLQRAAHIIAVSQATRDELLQYKLVPAERLSVIPNGVHPSSTPLPDPAADAVAASLLPEQGVRMVRLLNVGSTLPRKRLDVLLRVFAEVKREIPEAQLVRVGGFTETQVRLVRELGIEQSVVSLPFLDRKVLAAVYRCSTLLLHTAEAEGFGLPVTEALACGCPVVASDIPVLREVGGTAATFCKVADIAHWKSAVIRLLEERLEHPSVWEMRRQEGIASAACYSWAENARQTAHIYRQVVSRTSR